MFRRLIFLFLLMLPVHSLLQAQKSHKETKIGLWQYNPDFRLIDSCLIDSSLNGFQVYQNKYKYGNSFSQLGNDGLLLMSHRFHARKNHALPVLNAYFPYFRDRNQNLYYKTNRPYTLLYFSGGGNQDENGQVLRAQHSQNVNENFNFALDYDLVSSDGYYKNQAASTGSLNVSANYRNHGYRLHAFAFFNKAKSEQNGGIADDAKVIDGPSDPLTIDVNLSAASASLHQNIISVSSDFDIGKNENDSLPIDPNQELPFNHTLDLEFDDFTFLEENVPMSFWTDTLISSDTTHDELSYDRISNQWAYRLPFKVFRQKHEDVNVFLRNVFEKYTCFSHAKWYNTSSVGLAYSLRNPESLDVRVKAELFLLGYKAGDVRVDGSGEIKFGSGKLGLSLLLSREEPSLFYQYYFSNHHQWDHDFSDPSKASFTVYYKNQAANFKISASYTAVNSFIYIDESIQPSQADGILRIPAINVEKKFRAGKFHSVENIDLQYSTKDYLPLPLVSLHSSNYFDFTVHFKSTGGKIHFQTGFDIMYYTKCGGYAFSPALNMFYPQAEQEFGNYPYIDVFINAHLKRTRFFFKYLHANAGFPSNNYFNTLHYPERPGFFRFGIAWSFYN